MRKESPVITKEHKIKKKENDRPALLSITREAAHEVSRLLKMRQSASVGVRISVRTRGCSGLSYALEYLDQDNPQDEKITQHGVTVYCDPKAVMFLVGSVMDFRQEKLQSGFVFTNPNEKGRCGCGESFHV